MPNCFDTTQYEVQYFYEITMMQLARLKENNSNTNTGYNNEQNPFPKLNVNSINLNLTP